MEDFDMEELDLINDKVYAISGKRVVLDRDLAELYGVEAGVLIQAVKKNKTHFPADFMFQLDAEEWRILKSQSVMANFKSVKTPPYAFTERGVAMLSSFLNSEVAVEINVRLMRTFVAVRQYIDSQKSRTGRLESRLKKIETLLDDILTDGENVREEIRIRLTHIDRALAGLQANRKPAGRDITKRGDKNKANPNG